MADGLTDDQVGQALDYLGQKQPPLGPRLTTLPSASAAGGGAIGAPITGTVGGRLGEAGSPMGRERISGGGPSPFGVAKGSLKLAQEVAKFLRSQQGGTGETLSGVASTPELGAATSILGPAGGTPRGALGEGTAAGAPFPLAMNPNDPLQALAQIPGIENFSPEALRSTLAAIQGEQGLAEFAGGAGGASGVGAATGAGAGAATSGVGGALGSAGAILGALASITGNKELGVASKVAGPTLGAAGLASSGLPLLSLAASEGLGVLAPVVGSIIQGLTEGATTEAEKKLHFAGIVKDIAGAIPTEFAFSRGTLQKPDFPRGDVRHLMLGVPTDAPNRNLIENYLGSFAQLKQAEQSMSDVLQSGRREHGITVPDFSAARPTFEAFGRRALQQFLADQQALQAAGVTEDQLRAFGMPLAFTPRGIDRSTRVDALSAVEGGGGGDVTVPVGTLFASDPIARRYAAEFQYRDPLPSLGPLRDPSEGFAQAYYPFTTAEERQAFPTEVFDAQFDRSGAPYVPVTAGPPAAHVGPAEMSSVQAALNTLAQGPLTPEARRRRAMMGEAAPVIPAGPEQALGFAGPDSALGFAGNVVGP